jgi:hypothetical protein
LIWTSCVLSSVKLQKTRKKKLLLSSLFTAK